MKIRTASGILASAVALFTAASWADTPASDEAAFRALYKQLVEINTTRSVGSCTAAAEAMRAHLLDAGVPAAVVIPPRDIAANQQLRHRRLFEVEHHPVTGDHEVPTLPFRFSRVGHWLRSPAPTLGRDNDSVLAELGYSRAETQRLHEAGFVGEVPKGA